MPWTLYRYIFKELIRLLLLSSAALVLVIGFAVSIKPMMDGVLGPVGLVKLLLYTIPTVLGFAVPFSAAFSSTLVFCRMAADNEVQACRAVGLSYWTILLPVMMLGVVLTLGMLYLGNWIVPTFYRDAEGMVQQNLVDLIVAQVQRGEPVELPNSTTVIYANSVTRAAVTPEPGQAIQPYALIKFDGVAMGKIARDGTLRSDMTAQQAQVLLYHDDSGQAWYDMMLTNVMMVQKGEFVSSASQRLLPERVPNPLKDRARFLSWPELRQTLSNPDRFVQPFKDKLVSTMATQQLLEALQGEFSAPGLGHGRVTLKTGGEGGQEERYVIRAPTAVLNSKDQNLVLWPSGKEKVVVECLRGGPPVSRFVMLKAVLHVTTTADGLAQVELEMDEVTSINLYQGGAQGGRSTLPIKGLKWAGPAGPDLAHTPALKLLPMAAQDYPHAQPVVTARRALAEEIDKLGRRLIATAFQRDASAVGCLLVLVLGGVLSIKLKNALPLVVYFWIFLLAFLAVVVTNSGEKLAPETGRPLAVALAVIWSGDLALLIAVAINFWQLTRT